MYCITIAFYIISFYFFLFYNILYGAAEHRLRGALANFWRYDMIWTLRQGNYEPFVVKDKVGRAQMSLGWASPWSVILSLQYSDTVDWATGRASGLYKHCMLVCWWWRFDWSFACLTARSRCHHSPPPSSLAPVKSGIETFWYRLTQLHLEKGRLNGEKITINLHHTGHQLQNRHMRIPRHHCLQFFFVHQRICYITGSSGTYYSSWNPQCTYPRPFTGP